MTFRMALAALLTLPSQWLFNLALAQEIQKKATLRFTVTNLFDTAPPHPYDHLAAYDLLGRRYTISLNVKF